MSEGVETFILEGGARSRKVLGASCLLCNYRQYSHNIN